MNLRELGLINYGKVVMITKRIVCLANSRKMGGRCIVGKELINGQSAGWVRPVSDRENEEVSEYERQYEDGSDPQLLDIINVPLLEPKLKPESPQRENWLLDTESYWERDGYMSLCDLVSLVDNEEPLWLNEGSTRNGLNDRVSLSSAGNLGNSLRLIRVNKLTFSVFAPEENFGNPKRRVQGRFQYGGNEYHLWVTDPKCERFYLKRDNGEYEADSSFLTVSLGEHHKGYYYKFIVAVISCDGVTVK